MADSLHSHQPNATAAPYPTLSASPTKAALDEAIDRCSRYLLDIQYSDGYWWGELESNATMEAEFVLLHRFLGIEDDVKIGKLAKHILSKQNDEGAWGQFYGAPGDLSTSTECYFALKLAGVPADAPEMRRARQFILSKGGVPNTRVFTKIWLALLGQWDWRGIPIMPAELILLPDWMPVNIYSFSSWARATIVPLLVLLDRKPVRPVPDYARIDEIYPQPRSQTGYAVERPKRLIAWETFFYTGDAVLRQLERLPWKPMRGQALKRCADWIVAHQEADGSWGGIQPPWVYSLMALHELGYGIDHPVMEKGLSGFDRFVIEEEDTLRIQACVSPLWDTCLAITALLDAGLQPDHPALTTATDYLLRRQNLCGGDWQVKAKGTPPGGWAFEFDNRLYPDIDDTAEIVLALNRVQLPNEHTSTNGTVRAVAQHAHDLSAPKGSDSASFATERDKERAMRRAVHWLLGMQSSNGGWGSFDKNNSLSVLAKIPFADFGEIIDPPSVDVTAHVLEMLAALGYDAEHTAVRRALQYVLSEQESDGAWFGRWGVNYIYGVGAALPALSALGLDMGAPHARRAVHWLVERQNDDGGWGEDCASYVDAAYRGRGASTPSQTAWAIMALLAANEGANPAASRGVSFLIDRQNDDGSWDEPHYTGTGFPGYRGGARLRRYLRPDDFVYQSSGLPAGFMINYHLYRIYWPLMALGRYRRFVESR